MTDRSLAVAIAAGLPPGAVALAIIASCDGVVPVQSWGETSFFYNPEHELVRGAYFCTLKEHDGANDRASLLDRPDVYRLSFGVTPSTYVRLFGPRPSRPSKGRVVEGSWPFSALDRLTPHPVYAWMSWLAVLNPTAQTFDELRPLLAEAHWRARATFDRRLLRLGATKSLSGAPYIESFSRLASP